MKIAILYSGLPNNFDEFFHNHYTYLYQDYDVDTYLSSYVIDNQSYQQINNIIKLLKPKNIDIENFDKVQAQLIEIKNQYINNIRPECNAINSLSMFYKIFKVFQLINNKTDKYDIIVRNRLDIKFVKNITFYKNNKLNVPCGGDHHGGLLDLFGYGDYHVMRQYSSLFNFIARYCSEGTVFHPETLLRLHCYQSGIDINRFDFDIYLRDINFTQTAPCIK